MISEVQVGDAVTASSAAVATTLDMSGMPTTLVTGASAGIGREFRSAALCPQARRRTGFTHDAARLESLCAATCAFAYGHSCPRRFRPTFSISDGIAAVQARIGAIPTGPSTSW